MDQRMLLAIALSMLVMIGYYALFPPQPPPQQPAEPPLAAGQSAYSTPTSTLSTPTDGVGGLSGETPASAGEPAREIRVETPNYVAQVSTLGGELVSLRLKHYTVGMDHFDWGDVVPPLAQYFEEPGFNPGERVEMVERQLSGPGMLGTVFVEDAALTQSVARTVFAVEQDELILTDPDQTGALTLVGRTADGLTVRKTITVHGDNYELDYRVALINYGEAERQLRIQHLFGEGAVPTLDQRIGYGHVGPIYRDSEGLGTEDAEDLDRLFPVRDPDWLGIAEPYFLSAASAETPVAYGFLVGEPNPVPNAEREWLARYGMELPVVMLAPQKQVESEFRIYLGPKAEDELARFSETLPEAMDVTLGVLANPLLSMLRWFHGFVGNWGVAIILLTVVVRVALFPLTYKGMLSMKRMQKLQPKMVALREKFKNDRERMNREMMGLYKRYKVNPLGGCLPILLQLPIFFALYSALGSAIELRHTPFFGWITDLSAMDGLFILPVLMGASMVVQQRLTPTSLDPMQQKVLMWMPVIFTAFMFTFPAGLVLYWFTSNLLSILQQLVINRVKIPDLVERTT